MYAERHCMNPIWRSELIDRSLTPGIRDLSAFQVTQGRRKSPLLPYVGGNLNWPQTVGR